MSDGNRACTLGLMWVLAALLFASTSDLRAQDSLEDDASLVTLSFSEASIDTVTQWLAEVTGKSIIKHKDVNCSLNVLSSRKLPMGEAIRLVYAALALEGFTAVETARVITVVPDALADKVGKVMINGVDPLPTGRQLVVKVFELEHAKAGKIKTRLQAVVSANAKIEVDDRANKIIVTDIADNVYLVQRLLEELDIPTEMDLVTRVYHLKHVEAENVARILTAVFAGKSGAKPAPPQKQPQKPQPKKPTPSSLGASVIILADPASNRIVVTAPAETIPEIENLLRTLDTEKPADVAVRVIPLVHVDGQELQQELSSMYRHVSGRSFKDTIEISSNSRSNSLIVLSSESNYQKLVEVVRALDTEEAQQKATRMFSLQYADAEDIADQLEELFQDSRDVWWRPRRSNSVDVRFVPYRRSNEVIAIGPPSILEQIAEMIEMLDQPIGEEYLAPRIYQMHYVDAQDIREVLDELFQRKERNRPYWYSSGGFDDENDIGRLYGKVRFATEPYSNSIIVTTNSTENFEVVENILQKLDTRSPDREATVIIQLNYAKAVKVANSLNILFAGPGAPRLRQQPQNQPNRPNSNRNPPDPGSEGFDLDDNDDEEAYYPWLGSQGAGNSNPGGRQGRRIRPVSDLVGKVRVVPDGRTNALLVTTAPHFFQQVRDVVNALDIATPQVLIEAKIIEVGVEDRDRLGVRWSPDGDAVFNSEDFDNSILVTGNAVNRETYVGSLLAMALREGSLSSTVNLDLLIQFLRKNTDTRVRAEPRLNVADNERGKLFFGARIPFITNTINTTEGGLNNSFEYRDVGVILEVTPNINANGQIALAVRVESSQIRQGETLFGGAIIDTRNYRTELTVEDGEILVLGGILQREETEVIRKIPILGDIPILGYLFKKRDTVTRDVELMVFLRTTITRSPEDVKRMMEAEKARTPNIQRFERDLEERDAAKREDDEE